MRHLKRNNSKKCFSLLREFVEESGAVDNKKGIAILALDQLQRAKRGQANFEKNEPFIISKKSSHWNVVCLKNVYPGSENFIGKLGLLY